MLHCFLNFIYPPRCGGCNARLSIDTDARLCGACLKLIERVPEPICELCGTPLQVPSSIAATITPGVPRESARCPACTDSPPYFSRARALTVYRRDLGEDNQVVPSILRRHKYGRNLSLSRALVECLGSMLPINGVDYDLVIPVPLHRRRLRWRGFNQAALLALAIARKIGCKIDVTALKRVRDTPPQTSQNRHERRQNVRGAFIVTRPDRIAHRRLLLVDDVMTTGATLDECARALLDAGARRVEVLTLARAI